MGRAFELASNGTNTTNFTCKELVGDENLADGKIPQVLGIAFGAWLGLTLAFLVLRYLASDYSRVGVATCSQYVQSVTSHSKLMDDHKERSLSLSTMMYEDKHWYTWFFNFFYRLRSSDLRNRCGPDATLYLSLHGHVILLLCVLSGITLLIILPINYLCGDNEAGVGGFSRTTISNLDPKSHVLWMHTLFSLLFLAITVGFMIHYSLQLGKQQQGHSLHSAMVQWIPSIVHREDIRQHLQEALPDTSVADVQIAYDVKNLVALNKKLTAVNDSLTEVESIKNDLRKEETIRIGWRKPFCCVKSFNRDAKSYYDNQHEELTRKIEHEKELVKNQKKLGIGFITFCKESDAKGFCDAYKFGRSRPRSSIYDDVKAGWWWVTTAPFPLDIIWENLSVHYIMWWLRWFFINAILLLFVFFFTTPSIIVASLNEIETFLANHTHVQMNPEFLNQTYTNPLLRILIPNLLLLFFASLLPFCVAYSSYMEAHWTKSFREQTIMRKTYMFLVLMVIIMPAIGLASLNALAELAREKHFQDALMDRLGCVFLPNNGAFFVGYVITSGFIGSAVKLLRFPELALYTLNRFQAKTRLQRELALKRAANYEFSYGVEYAWNLVIFNMVISFSLTTPLIMPFGLVYFIFNYYVDKYNIYYVYRAAPFNGRQFLHKSAVNFVIVGAVFLQLSILFFSVIRLGQLDPRTVFMIVTCVLTCAACIGVMFFGLFAHLLPRLRIKFRKEYVLFGSSQGGYHLESLNDSEELEEATSKGAYIPPVLRETPQPDSPNDHSHSGFGYHSFGNTDHMGRKSASHTPSHTLPPSNPQQAKSTLERNADKAKSSTGGGGAGGRGGGGGIGSAVRKDTLTLKDNQPKLFV